MAAIFGHFLKSWEGKFSFQIEDTLSASIPCLFLLIYLAMPQNSETGRRQQRGEDVPKAQMVLKCQTLPEQSPEREGISAVSGAAGRAWYWKQMGGGGRPWALWWTPRMWVGTVWFDACWHWGHTLLEWRMSCGFSWWQQTHSQHCVHCSRRGVSRQQLLGCCIFALENKPRVTIPIK